MSQPSYAVASPYPQPGDVLDGKYRIEKLLGEGGMGAVAKATHLVRKAPVALKFMSIAVMAMPGAVERFVNEGVAASQIDSDHVVKVFDVGRMSSGAPYLVMEFLQGFDLGQLMEQQSVVLETPRAVHFVLQILRALQTAHSVGIIHRDMKPSNCFVIQKDGEPDFLKLVDFGISKLRGDEGGSKAANLTRTNSALGTPLYMSPEQARSPRDVDHRTDLYSVGAILYELLTGRTPYTSETGEFTEILFKIFTTEPEPLDTVRTDLPPGLSAVVHKALTRERDDRYASAADMAEALLPFADERSAQLVKVFRAAARGPGSAVINTPAPSMVTPASLLARASPAEATAQTFAGPPPSAKGAQVATDVGVTRESRVATSPSTASSKATRVAVAAACIFAASGAGFVLLHPTSTRAPAAATPDLVPSPSVLVEPPTANIPSAVLAPPPSTASIAPSAVPSSGTSHTSPPANSTAPGPSNHPTAAPPTGPTDFQNINRNKLK